MPTEDEADTPVDLEKLRRALETMTLAFRVSRGLTFPDDDRDLEYALVEYGCFGTLPYTRPLERHVEASGRARGESREQALARLDRVLDWVIAQAPTIKDWRRP